MTDWRNLFGAFDLDATEIEAARLTGDLADLAHDAGWASLVFIGRQLATCLESEARGRGGDVRRPLFALLACAALLVFVENEPTIRLTLPIGGCDRDIVVALGIGPDCDGSPAPAATFGLVDEFRRPEEEAPTA